MKDEACRRPAGHGAPRWGRRGGRALFSTQMTTSCISTTLVLVLVGIIVLFALVARNLSVFVRENINVSVLISDAVPADSITQLEKSLRRAPYVRQIDYISKQQALEEEIEAMGVDPTEFIDFNPFTASFEIKVKALYASDDSLSRIVRQLKGRSEVIDVVYQKELMQSVNRNIRKMSLILLVLIVLFGYISFELINNMVRLTIFSRRFSINTMKLVGASWSFIRRPFMRRALLLGLASAIVADALLLAGLHMWHRAEPQLGTVIHTETLLIVCAVVMLFGLFITTACTFFSLHKYLRMSSNELYHV